MSLFADVILPLPFDRYFTYSVAPADEKKVRRGSRVVVPFGRSKSYTAIVAALHADKPKSDFTIKEVTAVLDDHPILVPQQMKFWQWIADYYLCTIGEVYNAAIPSGMKVESETLVEMNESYHSNESLSDKEQALLGILGSMKNASIQELQKKSGEHNLLPIVKSLIDRGAVIVSEELRGNYRPRTEARIRFKDSVDQSRLDKLFTIFKGSPKREALLMKYVELSGCLRQHDAEPVSKSRLLTEAEASPVSLKGLIDKNIFEIYYEDIGRLDTIEQATTDIHPLNEYQQKALKEVEAAFEEKNVCLLHGVTSSGKTEVYIHLISEAIKAGKQVLYLLPEIALTTQITHRLKQVFGTRLGIYHSKFPDAERVEVWNKQLSDKPYDIILGVRSSVFLPFRKLGLVIVDEEHETTYKQQDPAPRYHARNAAIVLASLYGAKTLLGSATPSIESRYNAQTGKYGYVPLTHRYPRHQTATDSACGHEEDAEAERGERHLLLRTHQTDTRSLGKARTGDTLPKQTGLLAHHHVPYLRMDTAVCPLRRESHLSQAIEQADVPLLRVLYRGAAALSRLREHRAPRPRLRHGEDREQRARHLPRSSRGTYGFRHHPQPLVVRTHPVGLRTG